VDHAPYLTAEKGALGMDWLAAVVETADPNRLLNPGKLLPAPPTAQPAQNLKRLHEQGSTP
jgi:alkyldihydroxyacetonephosphate synthase